MNRLILALASQALDPKVAEAIGRWHQAIASADEAPHADADLNTRMLHLIRRDEVTRQNL